MSGRPEGTARPEDTELFVVGAHLRGQPLSPQLTDRGAVFVAEARTVAEYRLFALPSDPPKPGLVRVGQGGGTVVGERWRLSHEAFGSFVAAVPSPLVIGKVALEGVGLVPGFLCESWAVESASDITAHGGCLASLAHEADEVVEG